MTQERKFPFPPRVLEPHQSLDQLVKRARAVANARGVKLATVSRMISDNRTWLDDIAAGKCWPRAPTIKRAFERLADLETEVERSTKETKIGTAAQ